MLSKEYWWMQELQCSCQNSVILLCRQNLCVLSAVKTRFVWKQERNLCFLFVKSRTPSNVQCCMLEQISKHWQNLELTWADITPGSFKLLNCPKKYAPKLLTEMMAYIKVLKHLKYWYMYLNKNASTKCSSASKLVSTVSLVMTFCIKLKLKNKIKNKSPCTHNAITSPMCSVLHSHTI